MGRILIVEDELNQRELYSSELIEEGYDVETASNGREAVEKIQNEYYDIIIMDIRMPELDGIDAMQKILELCCNTRIIIYTAYSNYKYEMGGWRADAYMVKSSNLDELKDKIAELMEKEMV